MLWKCYMMATARSSNVNFEQMIKDALKTFEPFEYMGKKYEPHVCAYTKRSQDPATANPDIKVIRQLAPYNAFEMQVYFPMYDDKGKTLWTPEKIWAIMLKVLETQSHGKASGLFDIDAKMTQHTTHTFEKGILVEVQ